MKAFPKSPLLLSAALLCGTLTAAEKPLSLSGIYPHLAMFNEHGECGTGAVVPWQGKLWTVTYAPHRPEGGTDKLYSISPSLEQTIHPESIGGTPANRMIHRESNHLFIGPYAVDASSKVRAIPYSEMFGRPTGNARHLFDPINKIYYASMEEGIYEVDVHSLKVTEHWTDEQVKQGRHAKLPGYHGKGLYSGQGRLIYSNNGEHGQAALKDPNTPSGVLAEWDGKSDEWTIVRRAQFTDVTGPGGILGNPKPETDPVWAIGWDPRSLILMVLAKGEWHSYRLPKSSHSYDGAHGWNTEWPRIREIGGENFLMTMHGMFWNFPPTFTPTSSAGISPRSAYLKIVGDFCNWDGKIVLGCDDTAKSEFLNKNRFKGDLAGPGVSQSNLVFLDPAQLDSFGPPLGRGAVWMADEAKANTPSDPFLFSGFKRRGLHLHHDSGETVTFTLETDPGNGTWTKLRDIEAPPGKATWVSFPESEQAAWIRVMPDRDLSSVTAAFQYSAEDKRSDQPAAIFDGIAPAEATGYLAAKVHIREGNRETLTVASYVVEDGEVSATAAYELDSKLNLTRTEDDKVRYIEEKVAVPEDVVERDAASVILTDDEGRRWRLPHHPSYAAKGAVPARVSREVVTERNILHVDGTFYELPAPNAGGLSGVRPVATHHSRINEFASYRGLMVIGGIDPSGAGDNPHIIRSDDGKAALWAGSIDDLWAFGKPRGKGGPWFETPVKKDQPSDPYLFAGFDKKTLTLSHNSAEPVTFTLQMDLSGMAEWATTETFTVAPDEALTHDFPEGYSAYWLRLIPSSDTTATAQLSYH